MVGLVVPLVLLPAFFVGIVLWLFVKGQSAVALQGLTFAALGFAAMLWAISQSRALTAGIGYLGVPFAASVLGFLGIINSAALRGERNPSKKIISFSAFALAVVFMSFVIREGVKTREKNKVHNVAQAEFSAEVARE